MGVNPQFLCTSSVTTPMRFLLDPNISTTDIYTTLSNIWIEHDQITVIWEKSDLSMLPSDVAVQYASIMRTDAPTSTRGTGSSSTSVKQSAGASVTPLQSTSTPQVSSNTAITSSSSTSRGSQFGQKSSEFAQTTDSGKDSSASRGASHGWPGWFSVVLVAGSWWLGRLL